MPAAHGEVGCMGRATGADLRGGTDLPGTGGGLLLYLSDTAGAATIQDYMERVEEEDAVAVSAEFRPTLTLYVDIDATY
jgi:hypothetical protein